MNLFKDHMINHEEKKVLKYLEVAATEEELIGMGKDYLAYKERAPTTPHPACKIEN
jgi:hypothetical protein